MLADKTLCCGCGSCAQICPHGCIEMMPDPTGFLYPHINRERCVGCGLCQKVCPLLTGVSPDGTAAVPDAYAVRSRDDAVRSHSSSGGVFILIAEYVIRQGGVVFGACFDENWDVIHACAETVSQLGKFTGAKYVQSRPGDAFRQVREYLKAGRLVLFSGTPCQIGGLRAYLGRAYENLICQDMICHGVPAPGIWRQYLSLRERKAGAPVRDISFRCKRRGWKNYTLSMSFANGKKYQKSPSLDPYMRCFLSDLSLRRSCFQCAFKGSRRQADITLADFWGIQHISPELDDDKGTSLILIHSQKGQRLLEEIRKGAQVVPADLETALRYNPSAIVSAKMPPDYEQFHTAAVSLSADRLVGRYCKIPLDLRIKQEVYEKLQHWRLDDR